METNGNAHIEGQVVKNGVVLDVPEWISVDEFKNGIVDPTSPLYNIKSCEFHHTESPDECKGLETNPDYVFEKLRRRYDHGDDSKRLTDEENHALDDEVQSYQCPVYRVSFLVPFNTLNERLIDGYFSIVHDENLESSITASVTDEGLLITGLFAGWFDCNMLGAWIFEDSDYGRAMAVQHTVLKNGQSFSDYYSFMNAPVKTLFNNMTYYYCYDADID